MSIIRIVALILLAIVGTAVVVTAWSMMPSSSESVDADLDDSGTVDYIWYEGDIEYIVSIDASVGSHYTPRISVPWSMYQFTAADASVRQVADQIRNQTADLSEYNRAVVALKFVTSQIDYVSDTGLLDQWQYPDETLHLGHGDCEDVSFLAYSLLSELGFSVVIIQQPGHLAVGISVDGASGRSVSVDGTDYYYVEATGTHPIGWDNGNSIQFSFQPKLWNAAVALIVLIAAACAMAIVAIRS